MTLLDLAGIASAVFVGIGLACVTWRLLRGPSATDRAIAIDMLGLIGIACASLASVIAGHTGFIDVALGIAIVAFLTAVALAGLLERTSGNAPAGESRQ